jgi:hypothetical protein
LNSLVNLDRLTEKRINTFRTLLGNGVIGLGVETGIDLISWDKVFDLKGLGGGKSGLLEILVG